MEAKSKDKKRRIVAVGSENPAKLRGVARAWRLYEDAMIVSTTVRKDKYPQPISWQQTLRGALSRATQALETVETADYGVGVEAGLLPFPSPSGYMEAEIAFIVDKNYNVTMGVSTGFEVPYSFIGDMVKGEELGEIAGKTFKRNRLGEKIGLIGVLTRGCMTRADLTFQAVLTALVPRMNPRAYSSLKNLGWYLERLEEQSF